MLEVLAIAPPEVVEELFEVAMPRLEFPHQRHFDDVILKEWEKPTCPPGVPPGWDKKYPFPANLVERWSPLLERSNRALQKEAPIKPLARPMVKPINKENVQPVVNKGGKTMTFSQSFMKTKTLKEKQLKDEKFKAESAKTEQRPAAKPVLGAYRGKIIQSKINSFRKPLEGASIKSEATERKATTHNTAGKPSVSSRKPLVRPSSVNDVKKQRLPVPPILPKVRPSSSVAIKSNVNIMTTRTTTHNITKAQPQTKSTTSMATKSKAEPVPARRVTHTVASVTTHTKASTSTTFRNKSQHVTVRRTTHVANYNKAPEENLQQGPDTAESKGPDSTVLQSKKRVTIGPVSVLTNRQQTNPLTKPPVGKFPRQGESAEERKARLAEWRASKGIVMKRPPISEALPDTHKTQKEELEIKSEPDEPKEEPRQLFWVTMAEEDEQEVFTLKISQIFAECQKLINEGIPKEEILCVLEKQIENIPEAKKLSRYWECLARLEQREGQLYKVIEVCEKAVAAGAQPLDDLRTILADALEKLKADSGESQSKENEDQINEEEPKANEVKSELEESTLDDKKKRGRRRAMKHEPKSSTTPEKASKCENSPENEAATSSVIRFNISTTPHLEKMRRLQMQEGQSSIKGYKFLTPVRRSSRLEKKSHTFPDMLKDHDPCIAGISQLEELEDPESCPNAYIFRKNEALKEISAGSLTKD
ncbi:cytoskeleton-associated protein 2 [Gastrophryne carolinensis]